MRRGGVIKHQQRRRQPRQLTTVKRRAAAAGKEQRHRVSFPDDYVTTTLQYQRCIIVRLTGPYGLISANNDVDFHSFLSTKFFTKVFS